MIDRPNLSSGAPAVFSFLLLSSFSKEHAAFGLATEVFYTGEHAISHSASRLAAVRGDPYAEHFVGLAAVNQEFDVQVYDEFVIKGNTGVLRCQIPSYVKEYVTVTSWVRDDGLVVHADSDSGKLFGACLG
ncbi:hypothetical protein MTO96_051923 [Rhipicephalus appendiculatus]